MKHRTYKMWGEPQVGFVKSTRISRPDWDTYWMEMADVVKSRSTCLRRQVGAVIVNDNHMLTMGYNGAPSGLSHCNEKGCIRQKLNVKSGEQLSICRAVHAEQNAMIYAAKHGTSVKGATIYVTTSPCHTCAKMLINAGILRIVYREKYSDIAADMVLEEAKMNIQQL